MSKYLKQLSGQMRPQDDFGRALDEQALDTKRAQRRIAELEDALRHAEAVLTAYGLESHAGAVLARATLKKSHE